jgi:hypothetical protein
VLLQDLSQARRSLRGRHACRAVLELYGCRRCGACRCQRGHWHARARLQGTTALQLLLLACWVHACCCI